MRSIDADAHVIECEKTWDYLEGGDKRHRPVPITVDMPWSPTGKAVTTSTTPVGRNPEREPPAKAGARVEGSGKTQNFWIIGGRLIGGRDNVGQDTAKESREMANIDSRLKHMDEIGTEIQVLYPTLFLRPVTDDPRVELALCRSYNRWMADIWSKEKTRLRWAVQLPLLSMDQALDELRWARGNGACAVFMRGVESHYTLHDPYFFPLYEEAGRLNMPIGIHSGIGNFTINEMLGGEPFRVAKLMVIGGFHSMILNGIPEKFPKLRIGAIEVAAQWVPYIVHDLNLRFPKLAGKKARPDVLSGSNQLFVACQTDDDLPYVLKYAGENCLMIGSDYGHADNASELLALAKLKEKGDIEPSVIDKILWANPARFYGLD